LRHCQILTDFQSSFTSKFISDPDPATSFGPDRIRILNTGFYECMCLCRRHVGGCRTVCMGVTSLQLFFLNQGVSIAWPSHPLATFITTSPSIFSPRLFGPPPPTHPPPPRPRRKDVYISQHMVRIFQS